MAHSPGQSSQLKILLLFFISGSTSLVYEVVWMRRLSLVFGHSIFSVSTVLTVFMSGLALGSYLGGRWSDRRRRAGVEPAYFLRTYGRLEAFIGLWAILSLLLLNGVEAGFLSLSRDGVGQGPLTALLFFSSFLVLLPPTTAMGATLPIFTQALVLQKADTGRRLSQIYGLNTLGACFGAALGGLAALPSVGLVKTVVLTAVANVAIAFLAYSLARQARQAAESETTAVEGGGRAGAGSLWVPLVFGLSGFAGMVYQLGWTRALVLSIGSSTYAFSIILATYLAALGLGSILYKTLFSKVTGGPRVSHFALLQIGIGVSAVVVTALMGLLPAFKVKTLPLVGHSFALVATLDGLVVFLLLLLPTVGLGLTFPLVTHLYTSELEELGRRLGEAYSANTVGAILGSFLGGFVLIPLLGLENSVWVAVGSNVAGGMLLLVTHREARQAGKRVAVMLVGGLLFALLAPDWNLAMMSAGAGIGRDKGWLEPNPIFYQDGVSSTVTVKLNQGLYPYIQVNGKTDASFSPLDRRTQLLLGLVPAALHPEPEEVAVIGFGSGQTPVALLSLKSVKKLYCAELEPAVLEAAKFFAPFSEGYLDDPRLELVVDDGRSFILGSPRKFDIIVSEPSNPWIAGIGNLYTRDFYEGCRQQLKPGGIMGQWCHFYALSERELQLVYRTFFSVFPEGAIYRTSAGDLLLIGCEEPRFMTDQRLAQLYEDGSGTAFWLQNLGMVWPQMLRGTFLATRTEVVEYLNRLQPGFEQGPINTDDLPLLEFQAPLNLFAQRLPTGAYESFQQLVPPSQRSPQALLGAVLGRTVLELPTERSALLEALEQAREPELDWLVQRTLELIQGQVRVEAQELAGRPWWVRRFWLGRLAQEQGVQGLVPRYQALLAEAAPEARYSLLMEAAAQATEENHLDEARDFYRQATQLTSSDTPWVQMAILGEPAQWDIEALRKAVEIYPYSARTHHYLAIYLAAQGQAEEALKHALESHRLFPHHAGVLRLIIELSKRLGRADQALLYSEELRHLLLEQSEAATP